ncbi:hypothetical protein ACQ7B5_29710, partial [Escherichia coli]
SSAASDGDKRQDYDTGLPTQGVKVEEKKQKF